MHVNGGLESISKARHKPVHKIKEKIILSPADESKSLPSAVLLDIVNYSTKGRFTKLVSCLTKAKSSSSSTLQTAAWKKSSKTKITE